MINFQFLYITIYVISGHRYLRGEKLTPRLLIECLFDEILGIPSLYTSTQLQQAVVEQQETVDLRPHPWDKESGHGEVSLSRIPAYARMKSPEGQLYAIEAQYAKNWFEDILEIYQDNYVECLHNQISESQADADYFLGIATFGSSRAGRMRKPRKLRRDTSKPLHYFVLISK
jgi:hypothetical protein